jgi:hypothetical protein
MPDRGRLLLIVCVAALVIVTYVDTALIPLGLVAFTAAYAYAGYWGLVVRRGLVMQAYRNQALGVGVSTLYLVLVGAVAGAIPVNVGSERIPILVNALVDFGFPVIIFYWISTTVSIARRSDPLERDTFHFHIAKYAWAAAFIFPAGIALAYNPLALVFTVATPLNSISLALAITPFVILLPFGSALLLVCASRSKDSTLIGHIRWYAGAIAAFFCVGIIGALWKTTGGNLSPYAAIIDVVFLSGQFLAAYCFYRSAKSLVVMTKTL